MTFDKIKTESSLLITACGWGSLACICLFFLNIIAGKLMLMFKISINSPVHGPAEFMLFALVIIQFSIYVLLKERIREKQ